MKQLKGIHDCTLFTAFIQAHWSAKSEAIKLSVCVDETWFTRIDQPGGWAYDAPTLAGCERVRRHSYRRARSMLDRNLTASPTVPTLITARTWKGLGLLFASWMVLEDQTLLLSKIFAPASAWLWITLFERDHICNFLKLFKNIWIVLF